MPLARNAIENALAWLTVLSGLLLAAGVYIAVQSHRSAMSFVELSESQNALVTQLATFTRIQHEMGYTRFIHNFKNGVLRRDVDLLREAQGNIDNALASLDDLLSLNPSLRRLSENLKDTLAAYQDKADLAVTLVGEGTPAVLSPSKSCSGGRGTARLPAPLLKLTTTEPSAAAAAALPPPPLSATSSCEVYAANMVSRSP